MRVVCTTDVTTVDTGMQIKAGSPLPTFQLLGLIGSDGYLYLRGTENDYLHLKKVYYSRETTHHSSIVYRDLRIICAGTKAGFIEDGDVVSMWIYDDPLPEGFVKRTVGDVTVWRREGPRSELDLLRAKMESIELKNELLQKQVKELKRKLDK